MRSPVRSGEALAPSSSPPSSTVPRSGPPPRKDGRWNAERPSGDRSSVSLLLARTDLDAKGFSKNYDSAAHSQDMPRGPRRDRRRSSKVLASPISGHLSSYPITTPTLFFFHASHEVPPPSHMIISTHLPIGFGGHLAPCAFHPCFLILCASCFHYPLTSLTFTHPHPPFVVF